MGRKNYKTRETRKRHVVEYTPPDMASDYDVLMTNGSGVKRVRITGSRVSAWNYAIRLGLNEDDETMPGVWWPVDMTFICDQPDLFTAF